MNEWERFSAFGDMGELEHVCFILEENAGGDIPAGGLDDICGESSHLIQRLNAQALATEQMLDRDRPGLYDRTWIAALFGRLFVELEEIAEKPRLLPSYLSSVVLNLHRVLIAAHDVFDPVHREKLIANAEAVGVRKGVDSSKAARSAQSRKAVAARDDQKERAAFLEWGKAAVAAGVSASNVDALQALDGFGAAWSRRNAATLKTWAREAGFVFSTGRPKKRK